MTALTGRWIAFWVMACCAASLLLDTLPSTRPWQQMPYFFFAMVGTQLGATAYANSDSPRRPWWILGLAPLGAALADVARATAPMPTGRWLVDLGDAFGNLCWCVALVWLATIFRSHPLTEPITWRGRLAFIVTIVIAGSLASPLVAAMIHHGMPTSIVAWVATVRRILGILADVAAMLSAVALVRFTLPMRNGAAARAYLLLGACAGLFLFGGALSVVAGALELDLPRWLPIALSASAWALMGCAGLSQHVLLRKSVALLPQTLGLEASAR